MSNENIDFEILCRKRPRVARVRAKKVATGGPGGVDTTTEYEFYFNTIDLFEVGELDTIGSMTLNNVTFSVPSGSEFKKIGAHSLNLKFSTTDRFYENSPRLSNLSITYTEGKDPKRENYVIPLVNYFDPERNPAE